MLYHGPVRVPDDAVAGSATLTLNMAEDSKFESAANEIQVEIVAAETKKKKSK